MGNLPAVTNWRIRGMSKSAVAAEAGAVRSAAAAAIKGKEVGVRSTEHQRLA
jgi:hypothetical protein